jgi:hypothetical protein
MLLGMLITIALSVALFGVGLRRMFGWPTDLSRLGRWGIALLVAAVLLTALPELISEFARAVPQLPSVDPIILACTLGVVGLVVLGYVAWNEGSARRDLAREDEARTWQDERRPARPPAPEPSAGSAGARDGTFRRRRAEAERSP